MSGPFVMNCILAPAHIRFGIVCSSVTLVPRGALDVAVEGLPGSQQRHDDVDLAEIAKARKPCPTTLARHIHAGSLDR